MKNRENCVVYRRRHRLTMTNWQERITQNPNVCHGKLCIKGTRIMISIILDNLAEGLAFEEIIQEYPPLALEDIRAAIAYIDLANNQIK